MCGCDEEGGREMREMRDQIAQGRRKGGDMREKGEER